MQTLIQNRCTWFDNFIYYKFNPLDAEVKFHGSKWKSKVPNTGNSKSGISEEKAQDSVSGTSHKSFARLSVAKSHRMTMRWKKFGAGWKGLKQKHAQNSRRIDERKTNRRGFSGSQIEKKTDEVLGTGFFVRLIVAKSHRMTLRWKGLGFAEFLGSVTYGSGFFMNRKSNGLSIVLNIKI